MINITELKKMLLSEVEEKKDLPGNQEKIAQAAEPKDKITAADFAALRAKKGMKKEMDHSAIADKKIDASEKAFLQKIYKDAPVEKVPEKHRWALKMKEVDVKEVKVDYDFNKDELEKIVQTLKRHYSTLVNPIKAMEKALGKKVAAWDDLPIDEGQDHEVSMAHNSLESIIKSAMELKAKLGSDERNIPGWIQDHITNAENYIDQAAQGFHEIHGGEEDIDELPDGTEEEPVDDMHNMTLAGLMENMLDEKKKPSAGLTKKQKSAISKKAKAGKDIGKKGKGFEKIAKAAAEKYGSKERGQKVAAAAMWKSAAKKAK